MSKTAEQHPNATLASPDRQAVLDAVLELARVVHVEMDEQQIVSHHIDALTRLFPGRVFSVTLTAPESRQVALFQTSVESDAPPDPELKISREALERHSVPPQANGPGLRVVDREEPFQFDVPLMDGPNVAGVLSVEYPDGTTPPADDRSIVVQLTMNLQGLLRSARLLRESQYFKDYLSQLIDHANAPIMVIGRHRTIKVVNRAVLSLTGLSREALLGQDFLTVLAEDERPRVIPLIVKALRGEPVANVEVKLQCRDGGWARLAINTASLIGADGQVDAVIAIGRDLTEVRELEKQVIQAEKLATLGQLAAGVVHELNNPLTSISVYSDYLVKKFKEQGQEIGDIEKVRRIHQNTERILRFTRDLVIYARPSAGNPSFVSIHDVLDQSVLFCEHVISEAGALVHRRYAENLAPVYAIQAQLHQVFINLITNACHAMPEGAGKLIVETHQRRDSVHIRMTDNGPGVPFEQRERIFEPFYSTKGEGKGTGLGLSIVRNIVAAHGGQIRVGGEVGMGANFEIILPSRPAETDT